MALPEYLTQLKGHLVTHLEDMMRSRHAGQPVLEDRPGDHEVNLIITHWSDYHLDVKGTPVTKGSRSCTANCVYQLRTKLVKQLDMAYNLAYMASKWLDDALITHYGPLRLARKTVTEVAQELPAHGSPNLASRRQGRGLRMIHGSCLRNQPRIHGALVHGHLAAAVVGVSGPGARKRVCFCGVSVSFAR